MSSKLRRRVLNPPSASIPKTSKHNTVAPTVVRMRGRPGRAISELNETIAGRREAAPLRLVRALVWLDADELRKAVDDCAEAVRLKRNFAPPYAVRAIAEFKFGAHEPALAFSQLALELDPTIAAAHQVRGRVFEAREQYAEALAEFEQAIAVDPGWDPPILWHAL